MNSWPSCLLYTEDPALHQHLAGLLEPLAGVRRCADPAALDAALSQSGPALLFLDVLAAESRTIWERVRRETPRALVVLLAAPDSEAAQAAAEQGAYAVERPDIGRVPLQTLVRRAHQHLELLAENKLLREAAPPAPPVPPPQPANSAADALRSFIGALRHFERVETLLTCLVEGLATLVKTFRAGIFLPSRGDGVFRLQAGVRCVPGLDEFVLAADAPFVRWLRQHAQIVARATLGETEDLAERQLLARILDQLGAEVLLPLHGAKGLLGWILLGRRITGAPFQAAELEALMPLSEHVATVLETAMLHEEVALQRTLATTVLDSIPVGVVVVDAAARIRGFNPAAAALLDRAADKVLDQSAAVLPGRLGALLTAATEGAAPTEPVEMQDARTQRAFAVILRRLLVGDRQLGAVALVSDLTAERRLRAKEEHAERMAFWLELAAAMSHEIRNPLVAIKTFAQLLPEKYQDPEFRVQFAQTVADEVQRLAGIVDQINGFAAPPTLAFRALPVRPLIERALQRALETPVSEAAWVHVAVEDGLAPLRGDEETLVEALYHILRNAFEALEAHQAPRIMITAQSARVEGRSGGLIVTIEDNGPGIPAEQREHVFSPFYTTKPRGLGLGLALAQRTLLEHGGRIEICPAVKGARLALYWPAPLEEDAS